MKALVYVIACLVLPVGLIFGLRGPPTTTEPDAAEFTEPKPLGTCAYRDCQRSAVDTLPVRVTVGTDAESHRIIINVANRDVPLCAKDASHARKGKWPLYGAAFFLPLVFMIGFSLFVSVGLLGLGLVLGGRQKPAAPKR
ncbi:MAG: hypothetical protein HY904_13045 [Deltaproteobacteria bacterium]|nr:hypothetical protein [Deltaproteobacteria bacterium]